MPDIEHQVIEDFRSNGGKVGGQFEGMSLLLLTTTGAKSGKLRTVPLGYHRNGNHYYVLNGTVLYGAGASKRSGWYYNLLAHPVTTVEVGSDRFPAAARLLAGPERAERWSVFTASIPQLEHLPERAQRQVPIVELTPLVPHR